MTECAEKMAHTSAASAGRAGENRGSRGRRGDARGGGSSEWGTCSTKKLTRVFIAAVKQAGRLCKGVLSNANEEHAPPARKATCGGAELAGGGEAVKESVGRVGDVVLPLIPNSTSLRADAASTSKAKRLWSSGLLCALISSVPLLVLVKTEGELSGADVRESSNALKISIKEGIDGNMECPQLYLYGRHERGEGHGATR